MFESVFTPSATIVMPLPAVSTMPPSAAMLPLVISAVTSILSTVSKPLTVIVMPPVGTSSILIVSPSASPERIEIFVLPSRLITSAPPAASMLMLSLAVMSNVSPSSPPIRLISPLPPETLVISNVSLPLPPTRLISPLSPIVTFETWNTSAPPLPLSSTVLVKLSRASEISKVSLPVLPITVVLESASITFAALSKEIANPAPVSTVI